MKHLLLLILCLSLFSCKSKRSLVVPPAEFNEKIVERMVPYRTPADSAQLYALLECDSLSNVILKEFLELKSKGMQSAFSLNNNALSYNVQRPVDTVYIKVADTTRVSKIPYPVNVETLIKVNELTRFQSFQIKVAWVAEIIVLCLILIGINRVNIINILKNLIKI